MTDRGVGGHTHNSLDEQMEIDLVDTTLLDGEPAVVLRELQQTGPCFVPHPLIALPMAYWYVQAKQTPMNNLSQILRYTYRRYLTCAS